MACHPNRSKNCYCSISIWLRHTENCGILILHLEQYKITLQYINSDTPSGNVAEVHWGMALIAYAQANQVSSTSQCCTATKEMHLRTALEHAENARLLYRSIGAQLRADTVICQIAQIEQKLGAIDKVRRYLQEVLVTWAPALDELATNTTRDKQQQQEIANVVSSAAYSLADIELEAQHFDQALTILQSGTGSRKTQL